MAEVKISRAQQARIARAKLAEIRKQEEQALRESKREIARCSESIKPDSLKDFWVSMSQIVKEADKNRIFTASDDDGALDFNLEEILELTTIEKEIEDDKANSKTFGSKSYKINDQTYFRIQVTISDDPKTRAKIPETKTVKAEDK